MRGEGRIEQQDSPNVEQEKEEGIQWSQAIVKFGEEGLLGDEDDKEEHRNHNHDRQLQKGEGLESEHTEVEYHKEVTEKGVVGN